MPLSKALVYIVLWAFFGASAIYLFSIYERDQLISKVFQILLTQLLVCNIRLASSDLEKSENPKLSIAAHKSEPFRTQ